MFINEKYIPKKVRIQLLCEWIVDTMDAITECNYMLLSLDIIDLGEDTKAYIKDRLFYCDKHLRFLRGQLRKLA